MQINTSIPKKLKPFFQKEIKQYELAFNEVNLKKAWHHLERAHILGQRFPLEHSYTHWKMLLFGIKIKSKKEVIGQIPRLLVGGVKSFVGEIPVGNPGGSNVHPLKSFPISKDLQEIFKLAGLE